MWTLWVLCGVIASLRVQASGSCRYNCGYQVGDCSCSTSCEYRGNCCRDYKAYCQKTTSSPQTETTAEPSCQYNCGYHMGSCSCSSSCQYYGNCCHDYSSYCQPTTSLPQTETTALASCGGYLYSSSGTFYSPNYPNTYPSNSRCYWYIRPGRSVVELKFPFVDIYSHPSCAYDAIYVYDGQNSNNRLLGRLCGKKGATFHSTGSYLTVYFKSNYMNYYRGFRADYRVVSSGSCRYNCGYQVGSCSCSTSCEYRGNCCRDYKTYCQPTTSSPQTETTAEPSCQYNCGYHMGSCSCSSSCQYYGNCCHDYSSYCQPTTSLPQTETTALASCGGYLYSSSGTFYSPNYPNTYPSNSRCYWYIRPGRSVVELKFPFVDIYSHPSCAYDAIYVYDGQNSNNRLLGRLCGKKGATFHSTGSYLTVYFKSNYMNYYRGFRADYRVVSSGSCRYNCGYQVGSCSCSTSCEYRGNCCRDYKTYCQPTTSSPQTETTAEPSCQYNCGYHMGSCSCSSSCQYYGNCCHDYSFYCQPTTSLPQTETTALASCGGYLYSSSGTFYSPNYPNTYPSNSRCYWYIRPGRSVVELKFPFVDIYPSCAYSAIYVYDGYNSNNRLLGMLCSTNRATFHSTGPYLTVYFKTSYTNHYGGFRADYRVVSSGSCRYNCGYQVGNCSCSTSCEYRGNCCRDYKDYCSTAKPPTPTPAEPSCRYNCGYHMGNCSCSSSCQYYGDCCHDYSYYCSTAEPPTPTPTEPSCLYNCGYHMGSCSCSSSCQYYGDCCHDYSYYCKTTTPRPTTGSCGGHLYGSGTFTSPSHPSYYDDNTYCTWQLRAAYDQRIFLFFTYVQLENCCSCDYIAVYDGPSVSSRYLGKVCYSNGSSFISTSNYMTVVFRTDGSVVGRGFKAEFLNTLQSSSGQVNCSSEQMHIVVMRSYLNSTGYDGHNLYLNDPNCRPIITRTRVVFSFPIKTCGNIQTFEHGKVVYSNTLRAYSSNYGGITRQSNLKLSVSCQMEQDSVSQIMYLVHSRGNSSITGTGRFNTSMHFYTSSSYYYKVTEVPYEVTLNQDLYVQVELSKDNKNLVVFLDTCVTSQSPHDFHTRPYYLVRNGCSEDSTYQAYITGTQRYARFSFKAFQFLRATEAVYIHCKVLICPYTDKSRCRLGCRKRVSRDVGSDHESQTLVLGPIQLKDSEKKDEETREQDKA